MDSIAQRGEFVRLSRAPDLDGLECLTARFERHRYAPHIHETFAIGVVTAGAEAFRVSGSQQYATCGDVIAVNPEELHDGRAAEDSFTYRMLYPSTRLVREVLASSTVGRSSCPRLAGPVIRDSVVADELVRAHSLLELGAPDLIAHAAVGRAIELLFSRHGERRAPGPRSRVVAPEVYDARAFLDTHSESAVTLAALAGRVGMGRFQLLRAFRSAFGMTPHAYLTARRVDRAKRLIAAGNAVRDVAADAGFSDQSHLTRTFKAWTGMTPALYRQAVRT
ncbi:MAG: AraC family transcriptional regulator [Ectothiorhodospiraceae bacterium]|nr:AraC family transcriptional regulator [Ectothiorhodospiraceae bacterium]